MFEWIFQIILSIIFTDILVGIGHWIEDTWFSYCLNFPILGDIAKENEMHHYFPRSVCATTYIENISVSFYMSIITVGLFMLIAFLCFGSTIITKYYPFWITMYIVFTLSALIHRFQHDRDCERPWVITFLYKIGILESSEKHRYHHQHPTKRYCVILPWNNYWLDYFGFFRGLELMVSRIFNIPIDHKIPYDQYKIRTKIHKYTENNDCPDRPTQSDIKFLHNKLSTMYTCSN